MFETNLDVIGNLEQASKQTEKENGNCLLVHIDTGDADLSELCSDMENSDIDREEDCFDKLRQVFSAKKIE
jgi:hypothetical protein